VFDQPAVAAQAARTRDTAGLTSRCQAIGADFVVAVPAGGDAGLLKQILHDWDDERSVAILQTCRQAMTAHGRRRVIEFLIPSGKAPSYAKCLDVNILANLSGLLARLRRGAGPRVRAAAAALAA
jgi:hypothetical protein